MIDLLVISHACFMQINRSVYRLFKNDGWKVELVVPRTLRFPSGLKEAELPGDGDPPIHYLELKGANPRTYLFEGLIELLNEKKPRIILLDNDPVSRLALTVGKWGRANHARSYCISCENLPLGILSTVSRRGLKSFPVAIYKRIMLLRSRRNLDGVFTLNSDGKGIFTEEGFKSVERMPLGYDPRFFYHDKNARDDLRTKLRLDKKVVAYFGRLTEEKGIHVLIKALEGLKDQEWQLMMDKFDHYATEYSARVFGLLKESGIMDRVVFVNPSHSEIGSYMNAADIIVVPSVTVAHWKEQYGRVAAEALACGTPVLASDSGSLPELLNGRGIIFPEQNVNALRDLLSGFFADTALVPYGRPESLTTYALQQLSIYKQKEIMENVFATGRRAEIKPVAGR